MAATMIISNNNNGNLNTPNNGFESLSQVPRGTPARHNPYNADLPWIAGVAPSGRQVPSAPMSACRSRTQSVYTDSMYGDGSSMQDFSSTASSSSGSATAHSSSIIPVNILRQPQGYTAGYTFPASEQQKKVASSGPLPQATEVPAGVLAASLPEDSSLVLKHEALRCSGVPFLTYDEMSVHSMRNALKLATISRTPKEHLKRIFLGQLPLDLTPSMVSAVCLAVTGCPVVQAEIVTKRDPVTGIFKPTGCCHAYCAEEDATIIFDRFHKRVLVDWNGVWVCQRPEHTTFLKKYVSRTRNSNRNDELPHLLATAQYATTQYTGLRHNQPPKQLLK